MRGELVELQEFLSTFCNIKESESAMALEFVTCRRIAAGDYMEMQDNAPTKWAYIKEGLFRSFHRSESGEEYITRFFCERDVIALYPSRSGRDPVACFMQAIEESILITLDFEVFKHLPDGRLRLENARRLLAEDYLHVSDEKLQKLQTYTASVHYESFASDHPTLMGRIPQYMIASYLGITPVSLSRIVHGSRLKKMS